MKVLYVYSDRPESMNCSKHNCIFPAKAVNKLKGCESVVMKIDEFSSNTQEIQKIVNAADIIVIERNFFETTLTVMQFWRSRGKKIIAIFDDAYDIILPDNPSHSFWKNNQKIRLPDNITYRILAAFRGCPRDNDALWNNIPMEDREPLAVKVMEILKEKIPMTEEKFESVIPTLTQFIWGLKLATAIQVPSQMLKKDWKRYNKNIHYIDNYLEMEKYSNVAPMHPHEGIIIGWQGSVSHFASFEGSGVLKALENICKKNDDVKVMIGGDRKIFDALDLPAEKKVFHGYVPEEQWGSLLKSYDIGLAPLATEYDKRRSWIKVLEYMALKIPWVASNFVTYRKFKGMGELVQNTPEEWEKALQKMIDNIRFYKHQALGKPFEFALTQTFDANIAETIKLYEKIIKEPYIP